MLVTRVVAGRSNVLAGLGDDAIPVAEGHMLRSQCRSLVAQTLRHDLEEVLVVDVACAVRVAHKGVFLHFRFSDIASECLHEGSEVADRNESLFMNFEPFELFHAIVDFRRGQRLQTRCVNLDRHGDAKNMCRMYLY